MKRAGHVLMNHAEKVQQQRYNNDRPDYPQTFTRAPLRISVIAATAAEQQDQNYD
jgi:hypothetical protein